jgi:hypothetical protein
MLMSANGKGGVLSIVDWWAAKNTALTCSAGYALSLPTASVISANSAAAVGPGSADDDLAVHEGVDFAVVAECPLLFEAHRERVAGLDLATVEGTFVGGGVSGARGVGEDDPRPLGNFQRGRMELEVVDIDRLRPAGLRRPRLGSGGGLAGYKR